MSEGARCIAHWESRVDPMTRVPGCSARGDAQQSTTCSEQSGDVGRRGEGKSRHEVASKPVAREGSFRTNMTGNVNSWMT